MKISPVAFRLTAIVTAIVLVTSAPALAASKPSAPRSPSATAGDTNVTLRWTKPSTSGGKAIDHYAVQQYYSSAWHTVKTTGSTARSWVHTGLTNGLQYTYRIKAHNRIGWSPASTTVLATPRTTPTAPRFVSLAVGDSSATLKWQAPSSSGGASIDNYFVEWSTDGATFGVGISVTELEAVVTGLTPGTRYWFRVRAHNAAGYGTSTGVGHLDALTVPGDPGLVGINTSEEPEQGSLFLNWGWSAGPGAPLDRFQVQYSTEEDFDSDYLWYGPSTETTEVKLSDLEIGTQYWVRVRAINEIGWSAWAIGGPFVPPPGTPSVPLSLTAVPTMSGGGAAWVAPASDGGAPIDRYELEIRPNGLGTSQDLVTSNTSRLFAANEGESYLIRVRACHIAWTCGPWTNATPFYKPYS
ncbi:putative phage tail protein [Aeromicrobium panaciterrae]|uniref:Phage tail protein n=1 Tax=Aeromicrobium panaciterrae TaxID=363861 RepID=A0ABU1URZ1_9ACTN|nr:fibronectin type III domain-containing protein [Aeromicrobium panaciterrae]MDR7087957.1 putative phage tail protein [Aeromicrobium panaciterrae]